MSNEEVVECPKCKGTLDTGGECNDCDFDLQAVKKMFTCACCYGEFDDELTDAEKHADLYEMGYDFDDNGEDVSLVCDSCYCELTGVIPVNHSYMRYPQVLH